MDEGWESKAVRLRHQRLAVADERRPHDARVVQLATDIDLYVGASRDRQTGESDRALQGRGKGAAGDLAFPLAFTGIGYDYLLVRAQYAAPLEQQAHELALRPARANRLERLAADEGPFARLERHRPAEAGLEGMGALVHVAAVEVHAGFEPQRVAGAEPARGGAGGIQRHPHPLRFRCRQHDLETVFTRVTRARDEPTFYLASKKRLESKRGRGARRCQEACRLGACFRALD